MLEQHQTELEDERNRHDDNNIAKIPSFTRLDTEALDLTVTHHQNTDDNDENNLDKVKKAFESELERVKRDCDQQIERYKQRISLMSQTQKAELNELTSKVRALKDKHTESVKAYEAQIADLKQHIESLQVNSPDISEIRELIDNTASMMIVPQNISTKTNLSLVASIPAKPVSQSASNQNLGNICIKMNNNLSTFSGRPDQNVSEWIFQVNRLLEVSGHTDKEKIIVAANYLKDTALSDYIVEERENGMRSWEQFKSYKRFTPKTSLRRFEIS